jgi:hypothetical protein
MRQQSQLIARVIGLYEWLSWALLGEINGLYLKIISDISMAFLSMPDDESVSCSSSIWATYSS